MKSYENTDLLGFNHFIPLNLKFERGNGWVDSEKNITYINIIIPWKEVLCLWKAGEVFASSLTLDFPQAPNS